MPTTLEPVSTDLLDSLIKPATLALRLDVTERTLKLWRQNGQGPAYIRTPRAVFYRPEAVDSWLLGNERDRTAGTA